MGYDALGENNSSASQKLTTVMRMLAHEVLFVVGEELAAMEFHRRTFKLKSKL